MKKFSKRLSWSFFSNLIYAGSQFLTLAAIAKIGGPIEVGIFTLALAICSPVFLFLNVKLRSVILTDKNEDNNFNDYVSLRNVTNILSFFIIIVFSAFMNFDRFLYMSIILLAASKIYEMKIDLYYGFYQKHARYDLAGKSIILRGGISTFFIILIYFITKEIVFIMLTMLIINIIMYYFYDERIVRKTLQLERVKIYNKWKMKNLFLFALPLGISTVIGSLSTSFPRIVIESELGLYELGIYSSLSYLLVIGGTFLSAVSPVVMPTLAKYAQESKFIEFETLLKKLVLLGFMVSVGLNLIFIFWGELIIEIIYSADFAEYSNVLNIIVFGVIFLYTSVFLGTALTALRVFKYQPIINGLGLLMLIFLSLSLIGDFGLVGMSYALVANYLIISLGYLYFLNQTIKTLKGN